MLINVTTASILSITSPSPLREVEDDLDPLVQAESVTLTFVAVVVSLVAILSNGLLIYVVVRTSALHTATNFFIASLSAGEFLTGLFVIPFSGSSAASSDGWAFPPALCNFVGFVSVLGPCVSALSLLVVSVDRFVAISKPLKYTHLVNRMSTAVVIGIVWIFSLLIALLPLMGWGTFAFSSTFRTCLMRSSNEAHAGGLSGSQGNEVVVKELLCIFLPVTLIMLIILKTALHVRSHRRVFSFVPISVATTSLPAGSAAAKANNSRAKATRTLVLVAAAFLILCVPGAVAEVLCQRRLKCLVDGGSPGPLAVLLRFFLWLSFLSCVVNPIIIMGLNGKFRASLRILFCRRRRCKLCGVIVVSGSVVHPADKDPFTITSGLHAVLEASLMVNVMHGTGRKDANIRRQVIMTLQNRMAELNHLTISHLSGHGREGGRGPVQLMTFRRTHSSPDLRVPGLPLSADAAAVVAAMTAAMASDDEGEGGSKSGGGGHGQRIEKRGQHRLEPVKEGGSGWKRRRGGSERISRKTSFEKTKTEI